MKVSMSESKPQPKIICVNSFFTTLVYAIWFFSFIIILLGLAATYIELPTVTLEPIANKILFGGWSEFCYNSVFEHKKVCSWTDIDVNPIVTDTDNPNWDRNPVLNRNYGLWFLLIIDFVILGVWLYRKQQKIKLSWCARQ